MERRNATIITRFPFNNPCPWINKGPEGGGGGGREGREEITRGPQSAARIRLLRNNIESVVRTLGRSQSARRETRIQPAKGKLRKSSCRILLVPSAAARLIKYAEDKWSLAMGGDVQRRLYIRDAKMSSAGGTL